MWREKAEQKNQENAERMMVKCWTNYESENFECHVTKMLCVQEVHVLTRDERWTLYKRWKMLNKRWNDAKQTMRYNWITYGKNHLMNNGRAMNERREITSKIP